MTQTEIKIGDFVEGSYKYGCVCGLVKKVLKNHLVVDEYQQCYNDYTSKNKELNITISRIFRVNDPKVNIIN